MPHPEENFVSENHPAVRAVVIREKMRAAVMRELKEVPLKTIAGWLEISVNGAQKIKTGRVLPRVEHLAMLGQHLPKLRETLLALAAP